MSDQPWYVVRDGTNIRWCFDEGNKYPKVFDTEEIAQREIERGEMHLNYQVPSVPISATEYDKKYSKFVGKAGERNVA